MRFLLPFKQFLILSFPLSESCERISNHHEATVCSPVRYGPRTPCDPSSRHLRSSTRRYKRCLPPQYNFSHRRLLAHKHIYRKPRPPTYYTLVVLGNHHPTKSTTQSSLEAKPPRWRCNLARASISTKLSTSWRESDTIPTVSVLMEHSTRISPSKDTSRYSRRLDRVLMVLSGKSFPHESHYHLVSGWIWRR